MHGPPCRPPRLNRESLPGHSMPRNPKPLFSRLSRAPILAPQDGPTPSQVLVCVFFLGCKFGDAVSQAAQAYLPACFPPPPPPTPGAPLPLPSVPPAARRLSMRLMRLAAVMGAAVAATALAVVTRAPGLFTNSPEVVAAMRGAAPLLATALSMHACTVGAEGLLIGSRQLGFLVRRGMACPDSHCSVQTSSEGFGTLRPPAHTPPHTLSSTSTCHPCSLLDGACQWTVLERRSGIYNRGVSSSLLTAPT